MSKQSIVISQFKGFAPRFRDMVAPGMAEQTWNCDLSRGKLEPIRSNTLIEAVASGYSSIVKYVDKWVYGMNAYFLQWRINDTDLLIYLEAGVIKRRIGDVVVDLGQPPPDVPTLQSVTQFKNLSDLSTYTWLPSASNGEIYCALTGVGDPSITSPGALYLNGVLATQGTVGILIAGQWAYGDNDSLGYQTIYLKIAIPSDDLVAGRYEWVASAVPDLYYFKDRYADFISLPANPWFVSTSEATFQLGTFGALNNLEFAYGDADSLDHDALYIKLATVPYAGEGYVTIFDSLGNATTWTMTASNPADPSAISSVTVEYVQGEGVLTGNYRYLVTFTREVAGYQDESGPSAPTYEAVLYKSQLQINRPVVNDPYAAYWNLYRLSTATGTYLLVAQIPIATTYYVDNIADADLGIAVPTWYTSSLGNEIIFAKPPFGIEGIATDIHAGMIFAWGGSDLYFSEPGIPDAWPTIYYINFPSKIKQVVPFAGSVAVLCETGPFRIDGTQPEQLQQSKPLGREPCLSDSACASNRGVLYLSDTGVVLFNLVDTQVISSPAFTEDWFEEHVAGSQVRICVSHDTVYLFAGQGCLLYNTTRKDWLTLSQTAQAVYVNPDDGDVYCLTDGIGIERLFDGDSLVLFTWDSGQLKGKDPEADKRWQLIRPKGTGDITVAASVDGVLVATKSMDLLSVLERDRHMSFPVTAYGKSLKLAISGMGSVEEMIIEYEL